VSGHTSFDVLRAHVLARPGAEQRLAELRRLIEHWYDRPRWRVVRLLDRLTRR
jgi:hypothetical protein